jgi:hypothetical protein
MPGESQNLSRRDRCPRAARQGCNLLVGPHGGRSEPDAGRGGPSADHSCFDKAGRLCRQQESRRHCGAGVRSGARACSSRRGTEPQLVEPGTLTVVLCTAKGSCCGPMLRELRCNLAARRGLAGDDDAVRARCRAAFQGVRVTRRARRAKARWRARRRALCRCRCGTGGLRPAACAAAAAARCCHAPVAGGMRAEAAAGLFSPENAIRTGSSRCRAAEEAAQADASSHADALQSIKMPQRQPGADAGAGQRDFLGLIRWTAVLGMRQAVAAPSRAASPLHAATRPPAARCCLMNSPGAAVTRGRHRCGHLRCSLMQPGAGAGCDIVCWIAIDARLFPATLTRAGRRRYIQRPHAATQLEPGK